MRIYFLLVDEPFYTPACVEPLLDRFAYLRLGYGATLAWIFLLVVLVLTMINFAFSRRWVFYRGGA